MADAMFPKFREPAGGSRIAAKASATLQFALYYYFAPRDKVELTPVALAPCLAIVICCRAMTLLVAAC